MSSTFRVICRCNGVQHYVYRSAEYNVYHCWRKLAYAGSTDQYTQTSDQLHAADSSDHCKTLLHQVRYSVVPVKLMLKLELVCLLHPVKV
jgi:hypothetical protein